MLSETTLGADFFPKYLKQSWKMSLKKATLSQNDRLAAPFQTRPQEIVFFFFGGGLLMLDISTQRHVDDELLVGQNFQNTFEGLLYLAASKQNDRLAFLSFWS